MISLCGSPPAGFFELIGIGLIVVILFFLFLSHYGVYKSGYYNEEFVYFSTGRKFLLYIGFLIINLCIIPLLIFLFLAVIFS